MNYWLDLFTVKTLEEFQKAGAKVSGFRERRLHTCEQIQPGDKLLCYLTGISRWVGVLRVTKPVEAISNPDHRGHEEMLEWVGGEFDPERFDLESVNKKLRRMRTRKS